MHSIYRILKNEKGSALVLVALSLTLIMFSVATVTDVGLMFANKIEVANAADAAALAGVQALPQNPVAAEELARDYAARNNINEISVSISSDNKEIAVSAQRTIGLFFAKVLGVESSTAAAQAKAKLEPATGIRGIVPLGIEDQEFVIGESYVLKYGAGDGPEGDYHPGWFGILALQGPGAKLYLEDLKHGFNEEILVGELLDIQTGNISGNTFEGVQNRIDRCTHIPYCTYDHYDPSCPRIMLIPTIEPYGNNQIRATGFHAFLVDTVEGMGVENYITGHFIQHTLSGSSDPLAQDNGIYVPRLSQ